MKIYVNARFLTQPVSGVQRYAIECSRTIKSIYQDVVFLTPPDIFNIAVAKELGAVVIGSRTGHLWEQLDLPAYLRAQGSPPLFNPCNTAPLFYKKNYITLHDLAFHYHPEWNSRLFSMWYNFLVPRLVRNSKHLFTVSQTVRQEIAECYHVPLTHISVTYNGIARKMLDARAASVSKEKIILSVGSFNKRKNHHLLIDAFMGSDLKEVYKLVIIGDKNKVFSETGLNDAKLVSNNIEVHRQMPEEELIEMYQRAELLVSLSAYEGFGIPVLEGLFNGCKVVCSDILVYRELYEGYAHFCAPNNRDSIVAAIKNAVKSAESAGSTVDKLLTKYDYAVSGRLVLDTMLGK